MVFPSAEMNLDGMVVPYPPYCTVRSSNEVKFWSASRRHGPHGVAAS